jgi:hypothetical protein
MQLMNVSRQFVLAAALLAALSVSEPSLLAAASAPAKKPNVLYVFSDMQRAYSMGCYGDKNARTPHLDAFAAKGVRLDAAMSPTPV